MVFAAITGNLEFGSEPNGSAGFFGLRYGLLDLLRVAIEVHRPLVQIACRNLQYPHRAFALELGYNSMASGLDSIFIIQNDSSKIERK